MTDEASRAASRRSSIVATSLIGSATVVGVLLGLLRMKAAAVLLGPVGIGLIGLLQGIVATVAMLATMGLGHAGTRQLAAATARDDSKAVAVARSALSWATYGLAAAAALTMWLFRRPIAELTLGDAQYAAVVGWLGIAVFLSLVATRQMAVLSGLRRVGDAAKVNVVTAVIALLLGTASIWLFADDGILFFVLSAPVGAVVAGWWFARKLRQPTHKASRPEIVGEWKALGRLGLAFMVGGLVVNACQLFIRSHIQQELGTDAVGQFHASWTLSVQFASLLLAGLSVEFYPRMTAIIERKEDPNRVHNDQIELTILLGAPAFLILVGGAAWLVPILFSGDFGPAAAILRWQLLGDVLRLSIWPLVYAMMAMGRTERLMLVESSTFVVMAGVTTFLLPRMGVTGAGAASLVAYSYFCIVLLWVGHGLTRFRLARRNALSIAVLFVACGAGAVLASYSELAALGAALGTSIAAAAYGYRRLVMLLELPAGAGPVALVRTLRNK